MIGGMSQRRTNSELPDWLASRALSAQTDIEEMTSESTQSGEPQQSAQIIRLPTLPMSWRDEMIYVPGSGIKVTQGGRTLGDPLIWEALMQSEGAAAATRLTEIDGNRFVDVADVAQSTSRVIFLICLFSIAMWTITGFVMIQPFLAAITMIGCTAFYIMGKRAKKEFSK